MEDPKFLKKLQLTVDKQRNLLTDEHAQGHVPSIKNLVFNQVFAAKKVDLALVECSAVNHDVHKKVKTWIALLDDCNPHLIAISEQNEVDSLHPVWELLYEKIRTELSELHHSLSDWYQHSKKSSRKASHTILEAPRDQ